MNLQLHFRLLVTVVLIPITSCFLLFHGWHHNTEHNTLSSFADLLHNAAQNTHSTCDNLWEYTALKSIRKTNPCASNTQIWVYLESLRKKSSQCFHELVTLLAGSPPGNNICHCQGTFNQTLPSHVGGWGQDNYWLCLAAKGCKELAAIFYSYSSDAIHSSPCQTHEHVWGPLKEVSQVGYLNTQDFIVEHLAATYSTSKMNTCQCHAGQASFHNKTTYPPPSATTTQQQTPARKSATPPSIKVSATPLRPG